MGRDGSGYAKVGIGKAEDVMADNSNRRAYTSARKVRQDPNFSNATFQILSTHTNITKGAMKEIEAAKVRQLRSEGHNLPYNRERDHRYHLPSYNK